MLEAELGWDGICVEPEESFYDRLVKGRKCSTDNRCLWDRTGERVSFTVFPTHKARSGITEVNKNIGDQSTAGAAARAVEAETVTLSDLLESHHAPPTIHYMCLDVEGAEGRILEPFDFRGPYHFLAVSVEGRWWDDLMLEAGFVAATNPFTDAIHEHYFLDAHLAGERPQLIKA